MDFNYYNVNGDIHCLKHLYFVEKIKEGYKVRCLYCEQMFFVKDIEDLYDKRYLDSFIHQDVIKRYHSYNYCFSEIQNFINDLTFNYPNLKNEEIINELEIFLYTLDLSKALISKKKCNNPISRYYYDQKLFYIEEQLNNSINKRDKYEKIKIKIKN